MGIYRCCSIEINYYFKTMSQILIVCYIKLVGISRWQNELNILVVLLSDKVINLEIRIYVVVPIDHSEKIMGFFLLVKNKSNNMFAEYTFLDGQCFLLKYYTVNSKCLKILRFGFWTIFILSKIKMQAKHTINRHFLCQEC